MKNTRLKKPRNGVHLVYDENSELAVPYLLIGNFKMLCAFLYPIVIYMNRIDIWIVLKNEATCIILSTRITANIQFYPYAKNIMS